MQRESPAGLPLVLQAAVWLWAALLLGAIFGRGQQIEIDHDVTSRLRYHAIPVAMSVLYHGRPHDYTAYQGLARAFQLPDDPIENRLAWAAFTYRPVPGEPTHFWAADDRGTADYVIGAFALFGPHAKSLYYFYFVVLGASVALALVDLGRYRKAAAFLIFAIAAVYATVSVIPLGNLTVQVFEYGLLYEPRLIELLSFVATLHLACTCFFDDRWPRRRIAAVAAQAAILIACYHMRSSVMWEIGFVIAANAVYWLRYQRTIRLPPWPVLCVVTQFVLLSAYHRVAYNPRYFQDLGGRTVWHNALMGLGFNPHLNGRYNLRIDDRAVIDGVIGYLRARNDPRLTPAWESSAILSSLGGHSAFDWFAYEAAAREYYWHIWRTDTRRVLQCYLRDKPAQIATVLIKAARTDANGERARGNLYFRPLALVSVIMVLPALVLIATSRGSPIAALGGALVLLVFSTAPGMMFYPVVHAMMGVFAAAALTAYLVLAVVVSAVVRALRHRASASTARQTFASSAGAPSSDVSTSAPFSIRVFTR